MAETANDTCIRCKGLGWYWRTPDGFNPFLAGGFQTARAMYKVTCNCAAVPPSPQPNVEPVAWRFRWVYPATGEPTAWAETHDHRVARQKEADGWDVRPLYEHPPALALTPAPVPQMEAHEAFLEAFENFRAENKQREAERQADIAGIQQMAKMVGATFEPYPAPESHVDGWNAHEEFKRSALAARQAFDHVVGKPTRLATVGKHEARNLQHLKGVYEAALEQSPEFADTLAWLLWWEIAKFDRLAELTQSSPAPVQHVTLVDINAVIALVKDCGEDAQPESEYRLACNDLVEALSEFAPAPVQHAKPKCWLLEEHIPGGSIRWYCFEHEHQCRARGLASIHEVTVTPLFAGPPPQPNLRVLDWSNFDGPKRNVEWTPDDQDLIYTALNYRDDDYGDADEDVGQQLVERLLAAWKRTAEGSTE